MNTHLSQTALALAVLAACGMLVSLSGCKSDTAPAVVIDAEKTGKPVSKYIYGQFIEHLGRCIYQGIWAEMLEDRKFFWPVGQGESPWKAVGGPGSVKMDKIRPFTGAHTPRVTLSGTGPGGLVQEGLALIEGREYVGRVVLAGDEGAAPVSVSLIWGGGPEARQTVHFDEIGTSMRPSPSPSRPARRPKPPGSRLSPPAAARSRSGRSRSCRPTMSRAFGLRSWRCSRSSTPRFIAGRAATSSAVMTGETGSATATGVRPAKIRPGRGSSITMSASTSTSI